MSKIPAYSWFPGDYLGSIDCQLMSLEEEGAYRRLLDCAWENNPQGYLPDNPKLLAKLLKISDRKFKKIWEIIATKFQRATDGRKLIFNARLLKQWEWQEERRLKNVENGKLGGRPSESDKSDRLANANPTVNRSVSNKKAIANPTANPNESLLGFGFTPGNYNSTSGGEETEVKETPPPPPKRNRTPVGSQNSLAAEIIQNWPFERRPNVKDSRRIAQALIHEFKHQARGEAASLFLRVLIQRKPEDPVAYALSVLGDIRSFCCKAFGRSRPPDVPENNYQAEPLDEKTIADYKELVDLVEPQLVGMADIKLVKRRQELVELVCAERGLETDMVAYHRVLSAVPEMKRVG